MSSIIHLPRITIQDSFTEVSREIKEGLHAAEDVWVSCFREGSASVHGKLRVLEKEGGGDIELEARDGVQVELVDQVSCSCSWKRSGELTTLAR